MSAFRFFLDNFRKFKSKWNLSSNLATWQCSICFGTQNMYFRVSRIYYHLPTSIPDISLQNATLFTISTLTVWELNMLMFEYLNNLFYWHLNGVYRIYAIVCLSVRPSVSVCPSLGFRSNCEYVCKCTISETEEAVKKSGWEACFTKIRFTCRKWCRAVDNSLYLYVDADFICKHILWWTGDNI
jgi:hypothetical protein